MAYNKFVSKDGRIYLDLSGDTIKPEDLRRGVTAHNNQGVLITGERNTDLTTEIITENGEYTPDKEYCGFSKVEVDVQPPLQQGKEVIPTKESQTVSKDIDDNNYYGLESVVVAPIPEEYITTDDATATASQILSGEIAYVKGERITGTMPNNAKVIKPLTVDNTECIIPAGYLNGESRVFIRPEILAGDKAIIPSEEQQDITPTNGCVLKKVTVNKIPDDYIKIKTEDASAEAVDIRAGKTAYIKGEKVDGKMPEYTGIKEKLYKGNDKYTIPEGHHDGTSSVSIQFEDTVTVQPSKELQTITPRDEYLLQDVKVYPIDSNKFIDKPTETLEITNNDTYDVLNYASATVNVQPSLQNKSATPKKTAQMIRPDSDYDGLKSVKVLAISTIDADITKNGEYYTENPEEIFFAKVNVNVQPPLQDTKVVTPSTEMQVIQPDTDYYGLKDVTVKPIPDEYIIPEGTTDITTNGTYDVLNYASATVNVQPPLQAKTVYPKDSAQNITPDSGYYGLESVKVASIQSSLQSIFKITYGETAPTVTNRLWVKTAEPNTLEIITTPEKDSTKLTFATALMPTMLSQADSVRIGTKVYIFGGAISGGYNKTNMVFDLTTHECKALTIPTSQLSNSLHKMGAAAVGTKIYFFGGQGGNPGNGIYVFDTTTNTFSTISTTAIPNPSVKAIATAAVGTKIYIFGGSYAVGDLDTIFVFDTTNNSLTKLDAKLPVAADYIAATAVGTKIYLFGGYSTNGCLNSIQIFDTLTNTLTTSNTTLPVGADSIGCASIDNKIYLFGGNTGGFGKEYLLSTINVFDTVTQQISTLNTTLPAGYEGISCIPSDSSTIYLFGGFNDAYYLNTISTFNIVDTEIPARTNTLLIETGNSNNVVQLLPNINLGINAVYFDDETGNRTKVPAAIYKNGAWTEI